MTIEEILNEMKRGADDIISPGLHPVRCVVLSKLRRFHKIEVA